jgi:hypothetical protein
MLSAIFVDRPRLAIVIAIVAISWYVHDENMADAPRGTQASLARSHLSHELIRMPGCPSSAVRLWIHG